MSIFNTAIKIARKPGEKFNLSFDRLHENKSKGICTSILLDTNILLGISNYMGATNGAPSESELSKFNLNEFVSFCRYCQTHKIPYSISPGFCIPEISPSSFDDVRERFDRFFPLHGLQVLDDPEGRSASPIIEVQNILCLPSDELKLRALPFLNICAMLLPVISETNAHPWAKFERYIELVKEYIGLFSEKELTVAKVVIGDLLKQNGSLFNKEGEDLIKDIQNNFARTKKRKFPKTFDDAIKIAFNGANDFTMITVAAERDGKPIDHIPMDVWLMSNDSKLVNYLAKLFGYCILEPGENGKYAEITLPKGFEVALMPYDAKVFTHKVLMGENRSFTRIDSDLWKTRVNEMINLLKLVLPGEPNK